VLRSPEFASEEARRLTGGAIVRWSGSASVCTPGRWPPP